jgi:NodT family efflux transporter outer membrane factor (OMF) lipoprotein
MAPHRHPSPSLGLLVAVGLLAGCATKEPPPRADLQKEALTAPTIPTAWKSGGATGDVADNWLATFGDPQLDALVHEAMVNNPDLRVTAARVQQAAQYVELARAAMKPQVGLGGTGGINASGGDTSSALQGLLLGVSWEPDLWGRMRYGRNAAQETYASAQADMEFARQSLAATVARSWFTATQTLLQKQIASEMVENSKQLVTLTGQRVKVGTANEQDAAFSRANLRTLEVSVQQADFAHTQAVRALELLLGRYPSAELAARPDLVALPGDTPAGVPLATLERRPDVIAAERRVAAAFHRVGEAKAARLPKLTLNLSGTVLDSEVLEFKQDYENPSLGAGVRLVAPLYTGGALTAQVEIRTLEQKEAVAQYARIALRALGDVETALAASHSLATQADLLAQVVAEQKKARDLLQSSYRVGRADLRSIEQQELSLHAARLDALRVQTDQLIQRVNLHLALGGSFEHPVPPTLAQKN